jgi:hypothetical protein
VQPEQQIVASVANSNISTQIEPVSLKAALLDRVIPAVEQNVSP